MEKWNVAYNNVYLILNHWVSSVESGWYFQFLALILSSFSFNSYNLFTCLALSVADPLLILLEIFSSYRFKCANIYHLKKSWSENF